MITRIPTVLVLALAGGASTAIALQERANNRVRDEIASLRSEKARLVALVATKPPPGRQEVPVASAVPARNQNRPASAAAAAEPSDTPLRSTVNVSQLRNAGRATPEAAYETLLWAATVGRDEDLAACLLLNPAGRERALALLARLSADSRKKYQNPEVLVALFLTEQVLKKVETVRILNIEVTDASATIRAESTNRLGRTRGGTFPMARSGDNWQLRVGDDTIESIERKLTGQPPPPQAK